VLKAADNEVLAAAIAAGDIDLVAHDVLAHWRRQLRWF
jgi:hypothetical protein